MQSFTHLLQLFHSSFSQRLLRCVRTENDECHKITYKVNLKTWIHNISLQATQILWNTRCETCDEVPVAFMASTPEAENIELLRWHRVTLCCNSQSVLRFSQHQWHPDGTNLAGTCQTDTESDMAVKTTVAVCEYGGAPTTQLYTPQDYLMNTNLASLSFPTFLGLPQVIRCRKDDLISHG